MNHSIDHYKLPLPTSTRRAESANKKKLKALMLMANSLIGDCIHQVELLFFSAPSVLAAVSAVLTKRAVLLQRHQPVTKVNPRRFPCVCVERASSHADSSHRTSRPTTEILFLHSED